MMRRYKNGIILILTVVVIILCAMLPAIVARIEDYLADQNVVYEDMKSVQFSRELNDTEKMYLLKGASVTTVSEEKTKLKSADMEEIVIAALATYTDSGYIKGSLADFSMTTCEPLLYYSNEIANLSGIFWRIDMELWDDLGQSIHLYIDDQTGKLLLISYECLETVYEKDTLSEQVGFLFHVYQSKMDWFNYEGIYGEEYEMLYGAHIITYRWGDITYGEIALKYVMTQNGFRVFIE